MDVSKRRRGIKLTPGDLQKLNVLRSEVVPLAATGCKCAIGATPDPSLQIIRSATVDYAVGHNVTKAEASPRRDHPEAAGQLEVAAGHDAGVGLDDAPRTLLAEFAKIKSGVVGLEVRPLDRPTAATPGPETNITLCPATAFGGGPRRLFCRLLVAERPIRRIMSGVLRPVRSGGSSQAGYGRID